MSRTFLFALPKEAALFFSASLKVFSLIFSTNAPSDKVIILFLSMVASLVPVIAALFMVTAFSLSGTFILSLSAVISIPTPEEIVLSLTVKLPATRFNLTASEDSTLTIAPFGTKIFWLAKSKTSSPPSDTPLIVTPSK